MAGSTRGQFLWHELMTTDPRGATAFYTKVANWSAQSAEKNPSYIEMAAGKTQLAGVTTVPSGSRAKGLSPSWLPYIGTDDAEVAVWEAQRLGGKVIRDTESMSGIGKLATLQDPFGAVFAVLEPAYQPTIKWPIPVGHFSWHELPTPDREGSFRFYSALFGWRKTEATDMGPPLGRYQMYGLQGKSLGGIYTQPREMGETSRWVLYIRVADAKKATDTARKLGATIVMGPMKIPGGDQIAVALDPSRVEFAVHSVRGRRPAAKKAASRKKKAAKKKPAGRTGSRRKAKR